jgi:ATP-dependent protease ClpP protease subunit
MAKPILLYSVIYSELAQEITEQILSTPKNQAIDIWLNSPGGSINAGWSILAALQDRETVNMTVVGDASSMAFFMLLFATNVSVYDTATLLIHRASIMSDEALTEDQIQGILAQNKILRQKLSERIDEQKFIKIVGKTFDQIFDMNARINVRITAQQAKDIGLVNNVIKLDVAKMNAIESRYFSEIMALSTSENENVITNKFNIMGKLSDLIFGEKDSLLVAVIGDTQVVYTKLDKGSKIKAIGKDAKPISGTFEAENKSITVVENEITAIAEVNKDKAELEAVKAELKALKDSQITAEDVAEVLVKLQEKQDAEIAALKAEFGKAKITASNPKLPLGEFKQEMKKEDGLTRREKIEAVQREMYEAKLKNKEA